MTGTQLPGYHQDEGLRPGEGLDEGLRPGIAGLRPGTAWLRPEETEEAGEKDSRSSMIIVSSDGGATAGDQPRCGHRE